MHKAGYPAAAIASVMEYGGVFEGRTIAVLQRIQEAKVRKILRERKKLLEKVFKGGVDNARE